MHYAAEKGNLELIKWLLSVGFSPDTVDGRGRTPLFETIEHNQSAACDLLISDGRANVAALNGD